MSCEISVGADCELPRSAPGQVYPDWSGLDSRYVRTLQLDWCDSMTSRSIPRQIKISSLTVHSLLCENQVWSFSTLRSYVLVRTSSLCGSQVRNLSNRKCSTLWSYVRVRTSSNDCSCVASTNHPSAYVKFVNYSEFVCCTANYKHMYLHFLPCLATL